jgi:hypothetical protein
LNAASLYGFDLEHLQRIADEIGPTVDEVATPVTVEEFPEETLSITVAEAKWRTAGATH